MWDVQLFKLNYDGKEAKAAFDVVQSQWLTMGEQTKAFESNFEALLGNKVDCLAVANCTAALHMALLALGVGAGDEVIIPALTFVANVNTVLMVGAIPVLADCTDLDNWNVSVDTLAKCITPRTKAIVVVHYAGYPCDMSSISHFCRERGIAVIEDVAHAPGAITAGRPCGTWGDIGCFSFYSNKNLSIGEGGMLSTSDPEISERLKLLRSHGMTAATLDRHLGRAISYDVAIAGLNYRLDEIRAAIGIVQLEKLHVSNQLRRDLTQRYRDNFAGTNVKIPYEYCPEGDIPVCHILPILLPESSVRSQVINELKENRIQSSIHYPPFWNFSAFEGMFSPSETPNCQIISVRQLTLPLYPMMTNDQVDLVSAALLADIDN